MEGKKENAKVAPEATNADKVMLYRSILHKPSIYYIEVLDNKTLPNELRGKGEIAFEVKPPVLNTITRVAMVLNDLPEEALDPATPPHKTAKYASKLCEVFAIMSHGNSDKKMPDWYIPFLLDNLQSAEMINLIQEISLKTGTSFFLPCFQNVSVMNPMMMQTKKELERILNPKGSTPTP